MKLTDKDIQDLKDDKDIIVKQHKIVKKND
jgi:hypothetical protein